MKKNITNILASLVLPLSAFGIFTPTIANADTIPMAEIQKSNSNQNIIPHVTNIQTGNFLYIISKPTDVQTLSGISPLMIINPDNIFHYSDVKVTMSDGTTLLRYKGELYVNMSNVEANILR
ncbi:hypothetical protein [Lactobacillus terrae]|uniref:hypothetical protein n=1 Tax=Lactobacillus terrae TaxID=2269374 RepID=UPI000C1B6532|nr:hypothetical protein [Lactobacillus terrae]